jgi:hypothetical protein
MRVGHPAERGDSRTFVDIVKRPDDRHGLRPPALADRRWAGCSQARPPSDPRQRMMIAGDAPK